MTKKERDQRNQMLTALECKRRATEAQWLQLNQHDQSLGKRDRQRLSELRERLDRLNNEIICAIVEEGK